MKTKNVILGLCALVFAIGSAFATLDASALSGEKVQFITSETAGENCEDGVLCIAISLSQPCATGGSQNCYATVTGLGNAKIRNSSCVILTNSDNAVAATLDRPACVTDIDNN